MLRKALFLVSGDLNDDREQGAFGTAVDAGHFAARRRRIAHARGPLVLEEQLALFDRIALAYGHRRPQINRVRPQDGYLPNRRTVFDHLLRRTSNGQVQPFFYYNFTTGHYARCAIPFQK